MSLSKVYKSGSYSGMDVLTFAEFDDEAGNGGGVKLAGRVCSQEEDWTPQKPQQAAAPEAPQASEPAPDIQQELEQAYLKGIQAGRDEAEQRIGSAVTAFSQALEDISRLREAILKNSTDDMLRLVMAIVEQVIPTEISTNPEIIHQTLKKALQAAVRSDEYHIRIHPDDFSVVMEKKPLLLASISGLKNITVESDPSISRGGCLVESQLGQVDATIETQLTEIWQKIAHAAQD